MLEKNILCIIPARGGSKGVPKKNIKDLNGNPLIHYSIVTSQESTYINKIIVSTDSQEIADVAEKLGVSVPFLRPKEISIDTSLDIEYIKHTLLWLEKNQAYKADYIVLLRPTTPIRKAIEIDKALEILSNNTLASSLRSSHKAAETPLKWFKTKDGFYTPICSEITLADTNQPRQAFEDVYIPNGYVDILKTETVQKNSNMYGEKILHFETVHSYEIDTMEDFEFIEYKIKRQKSAGKV